MAMEAIFNNKSNILGRELTQISEKNPFEIVPL
jgi:hypothetical protein